MKKREDRIDFNFSHFYFYFLLGVKKVEGWNK